MILSVLDYASVLVFALTGALAASRAQLDIIGFAFLASLTAVGGGTLRDLLLDRNPVFWIADPGIVPTACGAALLVFFTAHRMESRLRWLLWLDSFALAVAFGSVTTGVAPAPFVSGEPQAASIIARAMAPSIVESFMTFESGSVGAAWVGCYSHKVELRC